MERNPAQSASATRRHPAAFIRGCFFLLAGGTLPVLFMNPLAYLLTLGICYFMAIGLAKALF